MRDIAGYPVGIQEMFRQAGELIERLDRMEKDFRSWQASEEGRAWHAQEVRVQPSAEMLLLLGTPSRADQSRVRWEARAREASAQGAPL